MALLNTQKHVTPKFHSKISQFLGSLRALEAVADLFIDECLFGMPKMHGINQAHQL